MAPEANERVIPEAFTAWAVPSAPAVRMLPPARVVASAKNMVTRLVAPVLHPAVEAGKEKGPPHVSTEGEAAEAMGKFACVLGTTMRA